MSLVSLRSDVTAPELTLKVTAGAMPGPWCLSPITVVAAAGGGERGAAVAPDQLSLYAAPAQQKPREAEPGAGQLEESAAALRRSVEPYADRCRLAWRTVEPGFERVFGFGNEAYAYFKDPPKEFYPRAGIIGFTGVLGLLLARGSRLKKLVYPGGLMTLSASLYYPDKAAAFARSAGESVYERAVHTYAAAESLLKPAGRAGNEGEGGGDSGGSEGSRQQ